MEVYSATSAKTKKRLRRRKRRREKCGSWRVMKSPIGLRKIADGIEKRKNEFAETIALESAKPIKLARGEVERGIATFAWAAGEAERFVGEVVPSIRLPPERKNRLHETHSARRHLRHHAV
jgi:acyl-CoA reductase-like NAD-dependent aldehyde dehydrogenase